MQTLQIAWLVRSTFIYCRSSAWQSTLYIPKSWFMRWHKSDSIRENSVMEVDKLDELINSIRPHEPSLLRSVSEFSALNENVQMASQRSNQQNRYMRQRHISLCNNVINTEREPILLNKASNKTIFVQGTVFKFKFLLKHHDYFLITL